MSFFAKLEAAAHRNDTLLCIGLDPTPESCPSRFLAAGQDSQAESVDRAARTCEGLLAWNRAVVDATSDLVCCYKPNIAFYEAMGKAGMALLRATIGAIPPDIPVLLDAKRGDVGSTAAAYARACFEDLGVDAVTLSPYLGQDSIAPFAAYKDKGLFVLCHTSNPSAGTFQKLPVRGRQSDHEDRPLYMQVAREAVSWSPTVGLVVGATYPEALAEVRTAAPDAWLLAPGIGAQGGDLKAALASGLRADGLGVLVAATRSVTQADDPRQAAADIRDRIRAVQAQRRAQASLEEPPPDPQTAKSLKKLIVGLAELGALQFGDFTLASGKRSSMYVDLRLLVSQPNLMQAAAAPMPGN